MAARSARIDETSWSKANEKAWLWFGQTGNLTAHTIADNRGADVARSIVGTDREKVVISDRYPSYDWIEQHQYCWSHLRRDLQAMIDRQDEGSGVGTEVLASSDRLFHWWHKYRDGEMAWNTFLDFARPIRGASGRPWAGGCRAPARRRRRRAGCCWRARSPCGPSSGCGR